jgi:lysophospholipase L1-like esterase
MRHRLIRLAGAAVAAAALATALSWAPAAGASGAKRYYLSLGDSYSVGYQPGKGATAGYTGYVTKRLGLTLENFGCGGATTASILSVQGCTAPYGPAAGTGRAAYPTSTQVDAANAFLRAHPGRVALVTVSIGGNDITGCAAAANPVSCVLGLTGTLTTNVGQLAADLRAAAGPKVPIVGLTYPDVILGQWVHPPVSQTLATESVTAFQSIVNPALQSAYASAGASFVDVTAATGAYVPLSTTVTLSPYGTVPQAVARVCQLTWYCSLGNIHAKTTGYDLIGQLILTSLHGGPKA